MKVYVVRVLLNDIVSEVKERKILYKSLNEIRSFIKKKINVYLIYFCSNNCKPDGVKVKNLEDNVFELRIVLNSKWLLRVLFLQEGNLFLLFGAYLIKPKDYDDKYMKDKISNEYRKQIDKVRNIYEDFVGECKLEYVDLTEYFNC